MKTKTFDAVEMKRRGALSIYQMIAHLTPEQQLAFWQERTRTLRERQREAGARTDDSRSDTVGAGRTAEQ